MPANRKAAITAVLGAAVTALVTLLGAIPSSTGKAIVVSVALVVAGAVAIVFLLGWQKHEARSANPASSQPQSGTSVQFSSGGGSATASVAPKPKPRPSAASKTRNV